ncbi:MAG: CNNM domain-containing protein [bacterium]
MFLIVFLLISLMAASFIFSGSETLFFSFTDLEIKRFTKGNHLTARILGSLSKNRSAFLSSLLFLNTIVNIAFVSLSNLLFERLGFAGGEYALMKVIVITLVLLMFCEVTPKALAINNRKLFIYILIPAFLIFYIFSPLVLLTEKIFGKKKRRVSRKNSGMNEVLSYLKENEEHVKDEVEFLEKYGDLKNREILSVAVPRDGIIYLKSTATVLQAGLLFKRYRLSRVPVVSNDIDSIIGVFYMKDIINMDPKSPVESNMRKAHKIDYRAPVFKVMNYFLKNKTHMAVLVDSLGKTLGIVTLQDIVDDIVKPLQEEE